MNLKGPLQARKLVNGPSRSQATEASIPIKTMRAKTGALGHHTTWSQPGSIYYYQKLKGPTLLNKRRKAWEFSKSLRKCYRLTLQPMAVHL